VRSYYLVPAHLPRTRRTDDWRERQRAAWKVEHAPWREERERALEEHGTALALSPEEVLEHYEESDPWLCANVLSEHTRPLVEYACSLEGEELAELLTYGRLDLPLFRLPEPVSEHLSHRIRAEHEEGGLYRDEHLFDGGPPRFETFEDCLANTSVSVEWRQSALVLQAYVPDTGMTNWRAMTSESVREMQPEAMPRRLLLGMGYGDTSPEREQELRAQVRAWHASRPGSTATCASWGSSKIPTPETRDCRCRSIWAAWRANGSSALTYSNRWRSSVTSRWSLTTMISPIRSP
jgi:hypothetical protein